MQNSLPQNTTSNIALSRRGLLKAGCGFGYMAWAGMAQRAAASETSTPPSPLAAKPPHFPARAKRVIFLFMQGGPSQIDTFDHKPELTKYAGTEIDLDLNTVKMKGDLMPSRFQFYQHGESGLPISELFPHVAKHADDLCLINSMHCDSAAHPEATVAVHTGSFAFVRPSMGAWTVYGLGTENENLPGFVAVNPMDNLGGAINYGSAFLPATYQGTSTRVGRNAIAHVKNPSMSVAQQRKQLDLLQGMNRDYLDAAGQDTNIEGVIESYELAFRMQRSVPEVMDISSEPEHVRKMYGVDSRHTRDFGNQCLMARRLAESGVRFIELTLRGWDHHKGLHRGLQQASLRCDQPVAALIADLKQRGMLDDTLIVWGGEFGRTSVEQNGGDGRRHNPKGFTFWMAGGGVRGGMRYGATDPTGFRAVEDKVHTHDLHATILHLLGLDHTRLTYRHGGRDFRLTDVYGQVVKGILA